MSIGKPAKDPKTGRFLPRVPGAATPVRTRARKAVRTKLGELFLTDRLDGQGYVLQALGALLRGDHHLFEAGVFGLLCLCDAGTGQHDARERQAASDGFREV